MEHPHILEMRYRSFLYLWCFTRDYRPLVKSNLDMSNFYDWFPYGQPLQRADWLARIQNLHLMAYPCDQFTLGFSISSFLNVLNTAQFQWFMECASHLHPCAILNSKRHPWNLNDGHHATSDKWFLHKNWKWDICVGNRFEIWRFANLQQSFFQRHVKTFVLDGLCQSRINASQESVAGSGQGGEATRFSASEIGRFRGQPWCGFFLFEQVLPPVVIKHGNWTASVVFEWESNVHKHSSKEWLAPERGWVLIF